MSGKFRIVGTMDKWKKGDLPGNQRVDIVLVHYSKTKDGSICITPQLASDEEVDNAVNQLGLDLKKAGIAAKKSIKKINAKMLERT